MERAAKTWRHRARARPRVQMTKECRDAGDMGIGDMGWGRSRGAR